MTIGIDNILSKILPIEHGFQHIFDGAEEIFSIYSKEQCFELALTLFEHEAYQARMLATTILGKLAIEDNNALYFLKEQVSSNENWRVQEMLAKAFDKVCKHRGYEASLPLIEEWLNGNNPNIIRAVTEGLRIWTSRPFFKENPSMAIALISKHKAHESEYLRKSVGNAFKGYKQKTRRFDTARSAAMRFIESKNFFYLQTCSEVAKMNITMSKAILFIFLGLPAVGKSTLARFVAKEFEAVYLRIDTIEQGLKDLCRISVEGEGYRLAYRMASDNLQLNSNVVADSCNPIELTRREWEEVAAKSGCRFLNIEIV